MFATCHLCTTNANHASVTMLRLTSTQMLLTMLRCEVVHAGSRAHGAASSVLLMYTPPVVSLPPGSAWVATFYYQCRSVQCAQSYHMFFLAPLGGRLVNNVKACMTFKHDLRCLPEFAFMR